MSVNTGINVSIRGFTLVELVVGIVVLAVALVLMITLLFPQVNKSIDPVYQVRASELAQALLSEINGRGYDEQSGVMGGGFRCGELPAPNCTLQTDFGPDGEETDGTNTFRDLFDDVDDYHGLDESGADIQNALGLRDAALYSNFRVVVQVSYAGSRLGLSETDAKFFLVTVITPTGEQLRFSGFRSNY